MDFKDKNIPYEIGKKLKRVSFKTVQPYSINFVPAYVLIKKKKELIAVKGVLDFFSPEDLERLRGYDFLYLSRFISSIEFAKDAAVSLQSLLSQQEIGRDLAKVPIFRGVTLGMSPFEQSDSVLQILSRFWCQDQNLAIGLELYFVSVLVYELCGKIPVDLLCQAKVRGSKRLERSIGLSGLVVFLALHLGYFNLDFIKRLRDFVFMVATEDSYDLRFKSNFPAEIEELIELVLSRFEGKGDETVLAVGVANSSSRVTKKIQERLLRIRSLVRDRKSSTPSIFGELGFI